MPQRRDYIDELKGLGILLVVLGHFIEQYRMGYSFVSASFFCIYAFHMALFCICSGLVARFKICAAIDKENRNDNFLITLRAGGCYCISRVVVVRKKT